MINLFQPALGAEELAAVGRVFDSNWVGKGDVSAQFEQLFAAHVGVDPSQIQGVSCGTEGLFQSMSLLGIGPGDEVVLPTISFVGAANAIASCGAKPVFCDVDLRTLNPTAQHIEARVTRRTKALIILHYGGVPCQMTEICALAKQFNLTLIEDSACSVASRYRGQVCGTIGDIGLWSFDAMKILVTGDGGMIYCAEPALAQRARELLFLGLQSESGHQNPAPTRWWEFELSHPGRRAIMNDISSAIGIQQLKKLPGFIDRRQRIHQHYDQALTYDWLKTPPSIDAHMESSYYFYWIQLETSLRDRLATHLRVDNIYTTFRYFPLHRTKFYRSATPCLPGAETAAQTTLCLPIHQSLSEEDLSVILASISRFGQTL